MAMFNSYFDKLPEGMALVDGILLNDHWIVLTSSRLAVDSKKSLTIAGKVSEMFHCKLGTYVQCRSQIC